MSKQSKVNSSQTAEEHFVSQVELNHFVHHQHVHVKAHQIIRQIFFF